VAISDADFMIKRELIEALCEGLEAEERALRNQDFSGLEKAVKDLERIVSQLQVILGDLDPKTTTDLKASVGSVSVERLQKAMSSRQVVSELIQLQLFQIDSMLNPTASERLDETYNNRRSGLNKAKGAQKGKLSRHA
jgi:hypothetical protein